jgi:hypothetical protein
LRSDVVVAGALFAVAAAIGGHFVGTMRQTHRLADVTGLEQQLFGAAVMDVCGRGLVTPLLPMATGPETPANQHAVVEFLTQRREQLSCSEIPADLPTYAPSGMQGAAPYLLRLIRVPWRLGGTTWTAFDRLLGVLLGATVSLAYVFCRIFMRSFAAGLVAVALLLSPVQLANLGNIRDFSKAPFFVGTLIIVALVVCRERGALPLLLLSAAGGALAGVGFGIRADIALNLVLVLFAAGLFLPGKFRDTWRIRVAACGVAVAAFVIAAAPVLRSPSSSSNTWHWAILGYAHDFDAALGIAPAPYETGFFYDDSYVASVVDAYRGRVTGATNQVSVDMPEYTTASANYYRQLLTTFPADALLRAEAALIQVLTLPYRPGAVPSDALPPLVGPAFEWRARLLTLLAPIALLLFVVVAAAIGMRSPRVAGAVITMTILLGAYPAVQFQLRHYFHLELLSLALLGAVVSAATRGPFAAREPGAMTRAAVVVAVLAAAATIPLLVLRTYQQRTAAQLLERYERATLVPVPIGADRSGSTVVLASADDLLPPDDGSRSMRSEQVVVETRRDGCPGASVAVTFRYTMKPGGFDYTRTLNVPVGDEATGSRAFFTVYETGEQSPPPHHFVFDRVEVPAAQTGCVARLGRFAAPDDFQLLIPAVLPPDWRRRPLHQTLRALERPAIPDMTHD